MSGSVKINVIKAGRPGISYNQRLMCFILDALNMRHRTRGYHIGKCIKENPEVKAFVNIFAGPNGFSASYYNKTGELVVFNITFNEHFAEELLNKRMIANTADKELELIMDIMTTREGADLIIRLRKLKASVDIMKFEYE